MNRLTHLSLFTGIGGIDLAAEWAGFETVGQVEWADYPTKVLQKHWPEVERWRDIRTLTKEEFHDRTGLKTVDLVSGGFPCQPFSVAGKQKGKDDDRYLWPEMLRVIREIRPTWVLGENVPGIIKIAGREVCESLDCEGYDIAVFNYEAAAVGARHRRERVFFVGYRRDCHVENYRCTCWPWGILSRTDAMETEKQHANKSERSSCSPGNVSDAYGQRWAKEHIKARDIAQRAEEWKPCPTNSTSDIWTIEPRMGRVADGVPNRMDRIKCLGNAVVPQQVFPILKAIAEIEGKK